MIAASLSADLFIILTGVERVVRDFGRPTAAPLAEMTVATARELLAQGQFPPGSMGPKIDAAVRFVEAGGREVLITRAESLSEALEGKTGTLIRGSGDRGASDRVLGSSGHRFLGPSRGDVAMKRDYINENDWRPEEIRSLLDLAAQVKRRTGWVPERVWRGRPSR